MHVQRVLPPHVRRESWTVLGDDGPVEPIERYLAYLTDIERSPNTVKAYAHDLKDWFVFLTGQGLRRQLAQALGQLRASGIRPRSRASLPTIKTKPPSDNNRPLLTTAISRHADSSKTLPPTSPPRSGHRREEALNMTIDSRQATAAGRREHVLICHIRHGRGGHGGRRRWHRLGAAAG